MAASASLPRSAGECLRGHRRGTEKWRQMAHRRSTLQCRTMLCDARFRPFADAPQQADHSAMLAFSSSGMEAPSSCSSSAPAAPRLAKSLSAQLPMQQQQARAFLQLRKPLQEEVKDKLGSPDLAPPAGQCSAPCSCSTHSTGALSFSRPCQTPRYGFLAAWTSAVPVSMPGRVIGE